MVHKVNIQFYDYDKETLINYGEYGDNKDLYLYVDIKDESNVVVGWYTQKFNPKNQTSENNKCTFTTDGKIVTCTFLKFVNVSSSTDQLDITNNPVIFDYDVHTVDTVRLFYEAPVYDKVHPDITADDTVDGFKFMKESTKETIKLQRWDGSFLYINLDFQPQLSTAIKPEDEYWVRAVLEHKTTENTIFVKKIDTSSITGGNTLKILANKWRKPDDGSEKENEKFTGNEPYVTVQIIKTFKNQNQTEADVAKLDSNNFKGEVIAVGNAVKDYQLTNTNGQLDIDSNKINDDTTHTTTCDYNIVLTKQSMENAISPEEILGQAAEFGIVANRYDQFGHSESNFAVNYFFDNSNIDIDGSGDTPIPFYAADITRTAQNGTTNSNDPVLKLSEKTTVPADIYATSGDINATPKKIDSTNPYPTKTIPTDKTNIENYVQKLINDGKNKSTELASQTNLRPENSGTNYTVDTTGFPDGTTIYINADGILNSIKHGGWHINKLPNQSIVFNITKASNGSISTDYAGSQDGITIGEFYVDTEYNGEKVSVQSTTSAKNDDKEWNQRADEVILSHITFNVTNATRVHLDNVTGLFLLPEATYVTQSNGAGWILAAGIVDSHAEWHFYRHTRNYVAKGGFRLETKKNFVDGSGASLSLVDQNFTFNLYEIETKEGNTVYTRKETSSADTATGEIEFHSFAYSNQNVPVGQPKTFKYEIREVIPADAENSTEKRYDQATPDERIAGGFKKDGIEYAASIPLTVTATNVADTSSETGYKITLEVKTGDTTISPKDGTNPPVYDLISYSKVFTNTKSDTSASGSLYLGATKTMAYWPSGTTSFPFELTGSKITGSLTANAEENKPAVFRPINFTSEDVAATAATPYTYTIKENCPADYAQQGITCDPKVINVSVKLKEENGTIIPESVKVGETGVQTQTIDGNTVYVAGFFTNSYAASGQVTLNVEKTMMNNHWPVGNHSFTFQIEGKDERSKAKINVPGFEKTVTISSSGKPTADEISGQFGTINFTLDDVSATAENPYQFTITENAPDSPYETITIDSAKYYKKDGIYYYADPITISITLTDNGSGKINVLVNGAQITNEAYSAEITNAYHEDGTIQLMVTKSFGEGNAWPKGRTFEFTLSGTDEKSNKLLQDNSATIHKATASSTEAVSFGSIKISETDEGTYNFKITETVPSGAKNDGQNKVLDGVTYNAPLEKTFSITFSDDGSGNIIVQEEGHQDIHTDHTGQTIGFTVESFTNEYKAEGKLKLGVLKGIDFWPKDGEFNFEISGPKFDSTNNTASTDTAGHPAEFKELTFTQDDLKLTQPLTYTIKETGGSITCASGNTNCITYNTNASITATVTLSDDGQGHIIPFVTVDGTAKNPDLNNNNVVTVGAISGNTYTAEGEAELMVEKMMKNAHWPVGDHEFTFTITGDSGNANKLLGDPDSKEITLSTANLNDNKISGSFGKFNFDLSDVRATATPEGHYFFTIRENAPDHPDKEIRNEAGKVLYRVKDGITYPAAEIKIEMWFTDNGDGTIKPNVKFVNGDSINGGSENKFTVGSFTNAYHEEGTFQLAVTKSFDNDIWPKGKIEFTLEAVDNAAKELMTANQSTLKTDAEADSTHKKVSFGSIKIDEDHDGKSYQFKITEKVSAKAQDDGQGNKVLDGITYKPPFEKTVTLSFKDEGDGKIIPSIDGVSKQGEEILTIGTFENSYESAGALRIKAVKTLNGNPPADQQFSFNLFDSDGVHSETKQNDAEGNIVFSPIAYDLSDNGKTYVYTVNEVNSGRTISGITYSSQQYTVTAELSEENGKIIPSVTVKDKDGKDVSASLTQDNAGIYILSLGSFENTYSAAGKLRLRSAKTVNDRDGNKEEIHDNLPFELWYRSDWDKKDEDSSLQPFLTQKPIVQEDVRTAFDYDIEYTLESPAKPAVTADGVPRVSLPDLVSAGKARLSANKTYTVDYYLTEKTIVDRELKEPDQSFEIQVTLEDQGDGTILPTSLTVTESSSSFTSTLFLPSFLQDLFLYWTLPRKTTDR